MVSKRLGSRYVSGRSRDWLKMKNPDTPAVSEAGGAGDRCFPALSPLTCELEQQITPRLGSSVFCSSVDTFLRVFFVDLSQWAHPLRWGKTL